MGEVTLLIERARGGSRETFDRIFETLYPELRKIAHRRLSRGARDGRMETTALVNECYLRFIRRESLTPGDRAHFLAYSAIVMRSIIVDAPRLATTDRRGSDAQNVTLSSEMLNGLPNPADEILDVHAALGEPAHIDPRLASVIEMRYFGGMEVAEIAEALNLSKRTVTRDWDKARLMLAHSLQS